MIFLAGAGSLIESSRSLRRFRPSSTRLRHLRSSNDLDFDFIYAWTRLHNGQIWIIYSLFTYLKWLDIIICSRMQFSCTNCSWCIDRFMDRNKLFLEHYGTKLGPVPQVKLQGMAPLKKRCQLLINKSYLLCTKM